MAGSCSVLCASSTLPHAEQCHAALRYTVLCCAMLCCAGGPNTNDFSANHVVHHTIGVADLTQQYRAFKEVTCEAVVIQHLSGGQKWHL